MDKNLFHFLNLSSFLIIPIIIPAVGIYFKKRDKKIFSLSGNAFMVLSLLLVLIWIGVEISIPESPYSREPGVGYFDKFLALLVFFFAPVTFFQIGIYSIFENKLWLKVAGTVVALISFAIYFLLSLGGTP